MGHQHHYHYHDQHPVADSLVNLLTKANHDLNIIHFKLEKEFQQVYPDNVNPMNLVNRIKKIQEELTIVKDQCLELLAAKQDLIDKAQTILVGNRNLVKQMQASMAIPLDAEDPAFANFNQVIDEWANQVRLRTGEESHDSDSEDINKLLFSAIVRSN